jgi:hypothetical protein
MNEVFIYIKKSSLTIIPLIGLFVVFFIDKCNTYVETRKSILRKLLEGKIRFRNEINIHIQQVGKEGKSSEIIRSFSNHERDDIDYFVDQIIELKNRRDCVIGLLCICIVIFFLIFLILILQDSPFSITVSEKIFSCYSDFIFAIFVLNVTFLVIVIISMLLFIKKKY